QAAAHHLEVCDCTWTVVGPDNVSQVAEDAVHVESVGLDRTVGKKVQTQVSVICVDWRSVEVRNGSLNCDASYTALFVGANKAANCCGVSSKRSVPAAETGVSRETAGNQTSNTVPSWVIVAKPRADAEVIEYSSLRGVGDRYLRKYR